MVASPQICSSVYRLVVLQSSLRSSISDNKSVHAGVVCRHVGCSLVQSLVRLLVCHYGDYVPSVTHSQAHKLLSKLTTSIPPHNSSSVRAQQAEPGRGDSPFRQPPLLFGATPLVCCPDRLGSLRGLRPRTPRRGSTSSPLLSVSCSDIACSTLTSSPDLRSSGLPSL